MNTEDEPQNEDKDNSKTQEEEERKEVIQDFSKFIAEPSQARFKGNEQKQEQGIFTQIIS